jgi:hypothetical protein
VLTPDEDPLDAADLVELTEAEFDGDDEPPEEDRERTAD